MSQELDEDISSFNSRKVYSRSKTEILSTTALEILKPNPDRVAVYFSNKTTIVVLVEETKDPTATLGFALDAAGGILGFNTIYDGDLPLKRWAAIAESGTPTITVKELIRRPKRVES